MQVPMTLDEAKEWADKLPKNIKYYVCPWNDGYIVHSQTHIERHPDLIKEALYITTGIKK